MTFENIDKLFLENHYDLLEDDKLRPCKSVTRDAEASVRRFADYYKKNGRKKLNDADIMELCDSTTINDTTNTNVRVMREFGFISVISDGNYELTTKFLDYVQYNDNPGAYILEMMYSIRKKDDLTMYSNLILCTLREGYKYGQIISFPDSEEKFVAKVPDLQDRYNYRLRVYEIYGFSGRNKTPEDDVYTPNANYRVLTELKNLNLIAPSNKVDGLDTYELTPNGVHMLQNINKNLMSAETDDSDGILVEETLTPEWFKEKALEFPTLDQEAEDFRQEFLEKFSPDKLKLLSDTELLETIFLNANNKTNLCYTLEFDNDCRFIFGSIKSGTAYKYGLHYSQKNGSWATGTGRNPQLLSEEEAIELGTKIRDNLIAGVEVFEEMGEVKFIDDYEELFSRLFQATDGYINRVWFLKYYAMLFPTVFPPNYSANAQNTIIDKLALSKSDNTVIRMGIIRDFVDKCETSGVVFSRIFWKYCNNKDDDTEINEDEEIKEEEITMLNCLEKDRSPRTIKIHPLNSIVYGAPGTGKTYSTAEYAQAIIEGVSLAEYRASNPDRKEVMKKYNELVRAGQIVFTTFHQSYGYEEFIQGLRPDTTSDKMNFKTVDGVFKKIADRALNDDENNYVIIIDEINRANISKVFGELITLIEDDKRWGELNQTSATLQSGDPFAVPNNLYIVGTMNSADKSISLIDAALRRRFEFIEQKPDASLVTDPTMRDILVKLNNMLADQLDSADLLIGHSYFMNKTVDDLPKVLNNSIIPLLYEYFYDNKKKVMGVLNSAVEQVDYVIEDDKLGRIYVERQKNS